ncbi:MAG: DUF2156 domain-containing protein [Clostridia bacterium]|nr:DUF2156 domain-containing protein [Clostridia bacterium]
MITPKKITIDDKNIFNEYYNMCGYKNSEANFTNMFIWKDGYDMEYAVVDGFLVLMAKTTKGEPFYYFPAGSGNLKSVIEKLDDHYKSLGTVYSIRPLTEDTKHTLETEMPGFFRFERHRDYDDYVYEIKNLIELPGKEYHAKKNHFNSFVKNYQYSYNRITPDTQEMCKEKIIEWIKARGSDNVAEIKSIEEMFGHYNSLDVIGAYLEVDGDIAAITVGENHQGTALIHIEKANTQYKGAYAAINKLFLQNEFSELKYVNREEDMGIDGLRKAKLSYHPAFMIEKYIAFPVGE